MTFMHKLSRRLALLKDALPLAAVLLASCELRRTLTGADAELSLIHLLPASVSLQPNQMVDFTAVELDASGDTVNVPLLWSVTSGSIVDTGTTNSGRHYGRYKAGSDTGRVKVIARGKYGAVADTANVLVTLASVATVSIVPPAATIPAGGTVQLVATVRDSVGNVLTGRTVSWSASTGGIATVNGTGLVTGVTSGSATITATSEGQSGAAVITVTVPPPPASVATVQVTPSAASVAQGATVTLTATPRDSAGNVLSGRVVSWASGDQTIARVTGSGIVTGVAPGAVTITATSEGQSGTAAVTVTPPPPPGFPVFPGVEGFGTSTPAGRGGAILRVTNLNDAGPGSFRAAVTASGPRVVIFEVSGTISLASSMSISNPYLTIAGQTAPSPGITLRGASLVIDTHDVLIQHIRTRVGDGQVVENPDGIWIFEGAHNVVIDHVSASWGIDENASISAANTSSNPPRDITFRQCIFAEGLYNSVNTKGPHSKGLLLRRSGNTALIGNLFAHNVERNPEIKGEANTVVVNNVVYNADVKGSIYFSDADLVGPIMASVVGNVGLVGPNTPSGWKAIWVQSNLFDASRLYLNDNIGPGSSTTDPWAVVKNDKGSVIKAGTPPVWPPALTVRPSIEVEAWVLANAGARPADRDAVDRRVVDEVSRRAGRWIDSPNDVGGWPVLAENRRALTPPANPNSDDDGDGYTNLEEWLHQFAAAVEGR